jgi:general secretion pathway protein G
MQMERERTAVRTRLCWWRRLLCGGSAASGRGGFTLIELMIVAVVLGILAAAIVPRVMGRQEVARRNRAKSDIAALETALELFYLDMGRYPTSEEGLRVLYYEPEGESENWRRQLKKPLFNDPWGNQYEYRCPGIYSDLPFEIVSYGMDGEEGGEDDAADVQSWVEVEEEL